MKLHLLAACCGLLLTAAARAWDPAGHMLVGQIAWDSMTPEARAQAARLVKTLDARFSPQQPYNFVTAGCWMDDMRALGKDYRWLKLHYISIPWTAGGAPIAVPEGPSVLTGIDDSVKTLRDPRANPAARTEALGMLIHFIGDLHQPLHATSRNEDRGGNGYLIAGITFPDTKARSASNLHTFWDRAYRFDGAGGKIIEQWRGMPLAARPTKPGEGVIAQQAEKIMAEFPREKLPELAAPADALALAKESYALACASAYPPGEPPDNIEVRPLTPEFVHASHVIAARRIALAGYRLAALLNGLFAPR